MKAMICTLILIGSVFAQAPRFVKMSEDVVANWRDPNLIYTGDTKEKITVYKDTWTGKMYIMSSMQSGGGGVTNTLLDTFRIKIPTQLK